MRRDSAAQSAAEQVDYGRLRLEADPRRVGRNGAPFDDGRIVGETAEGLETRRVDLAPAEVQGSGDVQREQVPAMRPAGPARPALRLQGRDAPPVMSEAVAMHSVEQTDVALRRQPPPP